MTIRRKHSQRKKPVKQKVSEMVLGFARDSIALGENIEEKQEYLNSAVSAWNIACLDEKDTGRAIKRSMYAPQAGPSHNKFI